MAVRNIEKMVPVNVRKMNVYTFQSLAEQAAKHLQTSDDITNIGNLNSLRKDNMLQGFIHVELNNKKSDKA